MPLIGSGALPDPNTVDANEYDGWLIQSSDSKVKPKYYKLIVEGSVQSWLLADDDIIESSDPVINSDGSIVRLDELIADIEDLNTQLETVDW